MLNKIKQLNINHLIYFEYLTVRAYFSYFYVYLIFAVI